MVDSFSKGNRTKCNNKSQGRDPLPRAYPTVSSEVSKPKDSYQVQAEDLHHQTTS